MAIKFTKKAPQTSADKVTGKKEKGGGETIHEEIHENDTLPAVAVPAKHAVVHFKAGMTRNLGDFEFARVDVGIEYPCDPDKIDETLEYLSGWANGKLEAMLSAE